MTTEPPVQIGSAKRAARTERFRREVEEDEQRVATNRAHLRCFWTWPFGHEYVNVEVRGLIYKWLCVGCGKEKP